MQEGKLSAAQILLFEFISVELLFLQHKIVARLKIEVICAAPGIISVSTLRSSGFGPWNCWGNEQVEQTAFEHSTTKPVKLLG